MQIHEVEQMKAASTFLLPPLGWYAGVNLQGLVLTPFPAMLKFAVSVTPQSPFMLGGLLLGCAAAWSANWWLDNFGDDGFRGAKFRRFLRGTRLINWRQLKGQVLSANRKEVARLRKNDKQLEPRDLQPIMVGKLPMPLHLENRNTLICASIGAGKSVAMESMIASAIKRRDKLAIVDPNGTFYSKFSFKGDILINPFDGRTIGWSPFNEIRGIEDFDRMARSIIPPQVDGESEHWCAYARDVLADTMRKLLETQNPCVDTLVNILTRADGEQIKAFLKNTDSQGYFRDNAEKAIAGVQFLLNKYVRPLRSVALDSFSFHDWVHDPDAGNIFFTWDENKRTSLKPLVATWIDTICSTILSHEPMTNKRLWLMLDELDSLGKLESFVPAATKGRKHGLRMVGSIQDWSQLDSNYGKDGAATILSCFRNYLIFGAANAVNADKASQIIGHHEVERLKVSYNNMGKGNSRSFAHEKEAVVMDSEISNLPDLTGYVKFGEDFPAARLSIPYVEYPRRTKPIESKVV